MNIPLIVQAIALALYALPMLFVPSTFWSLYGVTLGDGATVLARLFAGVALGNAVLSWQARNAGHSELRQAVLLAFFIHWTVGFLVTLTGQIVSSLIQVSRNGYQRSFYLLIDVADEPPSKEKERKSL